jgi:hypothetical protein
LVIEMGRISVTISDELEKDLRFKTVERFGGKKGDLTRAVEEAIKAWIPKKNRFKLKRGKIIRAFFPRCA